MIRQFSLVKLDKEYKEFLEQSCPESELLQENVYTYLGDIPNMEGHCVLLGRGGKAYFPYHPEDFVEMAEDEV